MKMGIIQGRLSRPTEGFQETPSKWWDEFLMLPDLGLNHIEWIVTKDSFESNPIFNAAESFKDFSISSICADNLVDTRINDTEFLESNLTPLCRAALTHGIDTITIPILEDSNLSNYDKRDQFLTEMQDFSDRFPSLKFSFEIEDKMDVIADIIFMRENFYLTYDTGNMTTVGVDHRMYLHLFHEKINNIHLKDRDENNATVEPASGATEFTKIFEKLKEVEYSGIYTLQTARAAEGKERETIQRHINIFKELYNEC